MMVYRCSYIVSLGILDKLSEYLINVHGPIDDNVSAVEFIHHAVSLVSSVVCATCRRSVLCRDKTKAKPNH